MDIKNKKHGNSVHHHCTHSLLSEGIGDDTDTQYTDAPLLALKTSHSVCRLTPDFKRQATPCHISPHKTREDVELTTIATLYSQTINTCMYSVASLM